MDIPLATVEDFLEDVGELQAGAALVVTDIVAALLVDAEHFVHAPCAVKDAEKNFTYIYHIYFELQI